MDVKVGQIRVDFLLHDAIYVIIARREDGLYCIVFPSEAHKHISEANWFSARSLAHDKYIRDVTLLEKIVYGIENV